MTEADTAFTTGAKRDFHVRRRHVANTGTTVEKPSPSPVDNDRNKTTVEVWVFVWLLL